MVQTNLSMFLKENTPPYKKDYTYISRPYIRENTIIARQYQLDIARHAFSKNTAVILPTGLGKTIIAFLVIADILPKKILFLAPTKPLVQQHHENCIKFLKVNKNKIQMLAGNISSKKRIDLFNRATIIVATPQTIQNDLENNRYNLKDFGLVIFDEMHRAVEHYAYIFIANLCNCRILGLTASPGSKKKKIAKILKNLKISQIESRTRDDIDVKNHVKEILIDWIKVPMNTYLLTIQKPLNELYLEKLGKLNKLGILTYKKPEYLSKKDILGARATIQKRFRRKPFIFTIYNTLTVLLHTYHCLELLETQGVEPFLKYIEKYKKKQKQSRSELLFLNHLLLQQAVVLAQKEPTISHPKLAVLKQIVEHQLNEEPNSLILVFTQYRDTIESIEKTLKQLPQARFHRFIGQTAQETTKGMQQKEQQQIINQFRKREINILIATSIAEEGIDIPNVNKVIFYEPIPSEIRGIQRKGRTGRSHIGKVTILITEGTRDEAFFYAEKQKEQKMYDIVRKMK